MLDRSTLNKLIDHAPLAVTVMGVVVFLAAAAGGLPVGEPPLAVASIAGASPSRSWARASSPPASFCCWREVGPGAPAGMSPATQTATASASTARGRWTRLPLPT